MTHTAHSHLCLQERVNFLVNFQVIITSIIVQKCLLFTKNILRAIEKGHFVT